MFVSIRLGLCNSHKYIEATPSISNKAEINDINNINACLRSKEFNKYIIFENFLINFSCYY